MGRKEQLPSLLLVLVQVRCWKFCGREATLALVARLLALRLMGATTEEEVMVIMALVVKVEATVVVIVVAEGGVGVITTASAGDELPKNGHYSRSRSQSRRASGERVWGSCLG